MMQSMLSTDSVPAAGCKWGQEFATVSWQHSEGIRESACKLARYAREGEPVRAMLPEVGRDPFDVVGVDIFQSHILPLLDSRSLARSAAVCSRWRPRALADALWQPLVDAFVAKRAHLPLCLMGRDFRNSAKQHLLYAIAVTESRQEALVPAEMCGRTWELRLKPPCGPYWLNLDPTQAGKAGLNRYFCCDGSLNSDPGDPIWGGHGCVWEFIRVDADSPTELVRINHWPPLAPRRVKDGRWVLENFYGLYITRPDNPAFSSSQQCNNKFAASERRRSCTNSSCTPPVYGFPRVSRMHSKARTFQNGSKPP